MQTRKSFCIFLSIFIAHISGCASIPVQIEDKYQFPEFEEVDSFSNLDMMGWEMVDSQSLIVQTAPATYFLLILNQAMNDLGVAETILLSSTGSRVQAKIDCVEAIGPMCEGSTPVTIQRIYRLNSSEDVIHAKSRIRSR